MKTKLTSRKFWICVAAFLASIAVSVTGLHSNNEVVVAIGTICGIISAAIYAFCEAMVDKQAVSYDKLDSIVNMLSKTNLGNNKEVDDGNNS